MVTRSLAAIALLLFVDSTPGLAGEESCARRTVPVVVLDGTARPRGGLTPSDFRAEVKGKPIQIVSVSLDSSPHRIVVVLDSSGSMNMDEDEWKLAESLAEEAMSSTPAQFQAGLIVFNDKVRERVPVGSDPNAALQILRGLPARPHRDDPSTGRKTAIMDALIAATKLMDPPQFGDSVFLITDGEDNESNEQLTAIRDAFGERGVRLFTEWFGYEFASHPATIELFGVNDFLEFARSTGGLMARVPPPEHSLRPMPKYSQLKAEQLNRIHADAQILLSAIQHPYRVELALPEPIKKREKWQLSIPMAKETAPRWVVAYPARLEGCTNSAAKPN